VRTFEPHKALQFLRSRRLAWGVALALTAALGLLYLACRSISLDDFDSISFALALRDLNLVKQQPQPPGFPVYVALGRLLLALRPDPRWALTTLSALSGAGAVAATFGLGHRLSEGKARVGLAAALLVGLAPAFWLASEKALSDVPGLALTLAAILGLALAPQAPGAIAAVGLLAGLSLGCRPQNLLGLVPFGLYALHGLWRARRWGRMGLYLAGGTLGVALWLVPLAAASGGWGSYLGLVQVHGRHVWAADSLFGHGPLGATIVRARLMQFGTTFFGEVLGLPLGQQAAAGSLLALGAVSVAALVAAALMARPRRAVVLLLAWLALGLAQSLLFESLERSRLLVPLLPPLALLAALALARLPLPAFAASLVLAGALLFGQTWPIARILATQAAPPVQATAYVQRHGTPDDTLLAAAGSYRHVQYALAGFRTHYLYYLDEAALAADVASGRYRQVVIFDRDAFQGVQEAFLEGDRYVATADLTFARDARAHREHGEVRLVVLTRADLLTPEDLALPASGVVRPGAAGDERFLGPGWFRREDVGGVAARWAGGSAEAKVNVALPPAGYRVRLRALAYPAEQVVTVLVNGVQVAEIALGQGWDEYEFQVPQSALTQPVAAMQLRHRLLRSPYEESGGTSTDTRTLAAAYEHFQFVATP